MKEYLLTFLLSSFNYVVAHQKHFFEEKDNDVQHLTQTHYNFEKKEENNQKLEQTKTVMEYVDELCHQSKKVRLIIGESNTDSNILDRFDEGCIFLDIEHNEKMKNRCITCSFVDIEELTKLSKNIGGKIDQIIFDNSVMKFAHVTQEVLECYKNVLRENGEFIYRFSISSFTLKMTIDSSKYHNDKDNQTNDYLLCCGWSFWGANEDEKNKIQKDIFNNNHKRILKTVFKNIEEKKGDLPFKEREYMYNKEDSIIICRK